MLSPAGPTANALVHSQNTSQKQRERDSHSWPPCSRPFKFVLVRRLYVHLLRVLLGLLQNLYGRGLRIEQPFIHGGIIGHSPRTVQALVFDKAPLEIAVRDISTYKWDGEHSGYSSVYGWNESRLTAYIASLRVKLVYSGNYIFAYHEL